MSTTTAIASALGRIVRRAGRGFARRRTSIIAALAVGALVAGVGVAAVVIFAPQVDCRVLEAPSFEEGAKVARACRTKVEVVSERTPWQTWWATPEGGGQLEATTLPSRVKQGDEWVNLDLSFVRQASSDVISLAAGPTPMFFSNGIRGSAGLSASSEVPLGQIESSAGETLKVWFPLPLPNPDVEDDKLTYDLGDGIRVVVSVTIDGTGFLPVVELSSPAAAAEFASRLEAARGSQGSGTGMDIEYRTDVSGDLAPVVDGTAIKFVDESGEEQFEVAPPTMWDSAGTPVTASSTGVTEVGLTDRTVSPAAGDHISSLEMGLTDDGIVLRPDAQMIADQTTVWPVYIDPQLGTQSPSTWIAVRSGGYTNTLYKWSDISPSSLGQGTGYCNSLPSCNVVFKQRLAWEFSSLSAIANMTGDDVTKATFKVYGAHSANCTNQATTPKRTSNISSSSTWSNMSISGTPAMVARSEFHSVSCGNTGYKEFNVTAGAKWIADQNQTWLDMALIVGETSITYWKRFRANATLIITYNRPPTVSDPRLKDPDIAGCTTVPADRPVIAKLQPTLSALVSDPDTGDLIQPQFQVAEASNTASPFITTTIPATALAKDSRAEYQVPALTNQHTYAWRVRAYDGKRYSIDWSPWCEFTVNTSIPAGPSVSPVLGGTGVAAIYLKDKERGGVGQTGKFTIDRGTQTDVTGFKYSFAGSTLTELAPVSGSTAVIQFTPQTAGPVTLTVKSMNTAGTLSAATTYVFTVATPTEDTIWALDEGTGTRSEDSSPGHNDLTVLGASWGDGPHADFDSREGDHALVFDGVDDAALADGPVVNTLGSFVISAHVKLAPGALAADQSYVALSQYGTIQAGLELGYAATCPDMNDGCWQFSMPDGIETTASTVVRSKVPVSENEWTHLVAQYDAANQSMSIWTCEVGTPTDPKPGEPARKDVARTATPWAASGAFVLGRGLSAAAGSRYWAGSIDNVRIFSGAVVSEAKIRRLCQGAEASDFGDDNLPLDPTTTVGQ